MRALTVARLSPVKDQATLLRAVARVVSEIPDFHLDIVGDGPSRVGLVSLTAELGLDTHVTFHGATDDVPRFLAGARLFVLSSISEGVPLTILEAMAAGLPVVSTDVGGVEEVVANQQTGLLVPPSDADALAGAMLELLLDSERSQRMGSAAQRRAQERFDAREMVRNYESLYHECLAKRS
jgi:glycosyltransferase involved in cell wall biosynthesis